MNIIKFYDGQINSLEYTVKFQDRVVLLASKYLDADKQYANPHWHVDVTSERPVDWYIRKLFDLEERLETAPHERDVLSFDSPVKLKVIGADLSLELLGNSSTSFQQGQEQYRGLRIHVPSANLVFERFGTHYIITVLSHLDLSKSVAALVAETGNVPIDAALLQPVLSEIYTFEK